MNTRAPQIKPTTLPSRQNKTHQGVDTANVKRKCALLASEGVAVGADGSVPTAALLTAAELRALAAAAAAPGKQR
jgi:hypothetical protein